MRTVVVCVWFAGRLDHETSRAAFERALPTSLGEGSVDDEREIGPLVEVAWKAGPGRMRRLGENEAARFQASEAGAQCDRAGKGLRVRVAHGESQF